MWFPNSGDYTNCLGGGKEKQALAKLLTKKSYVFIFILPGTDHERKLSLMSRITQLSLTGVFLSQLTGQLSGVSCHRVPIKENRRIFNVIHKG